MTPLRALEDIEIRILFDNVDYGELEDYTNREGPKQEDDEDEVEYWDRREEWKDAKKKEFLVLPNPKLFVRPNTNLSGAGSDKGDINKAEQKDDGGDDGGDDKVDLKRDFGATGLQIIVKLANIHLTPEKPEYEGGTWHVEGQLVCLTALLAPILIFCNRMNTSVPPLSITTITRTLLPVAWPSDNRRVSFI